MDSEVKPENRWFSMMMSDILDFDGFGATMPLTSFGSDANWCGLAQTDRETVTERMEFYSLESKYMPGSPRNVHRMAWKPSRTFAKQI